MKEFILAVIIGFAITYMIFSVFSELDSDFDIWCKNDKFAQENPEVCK